MLKVTSILLLLCIALACAEPRVQQHRGLDSGNGLVATNHPYLFLSVPRGRSGAVVQGFAIVEEDDDEDALADDTDDDDDDEDRMANNDADEDDNEDVMAKKPLALEDNDDDDERDEEQTVHDEEKAEPVPVVQRPMQQMLQQARPTQMMVSREHAGAIMVPDGFIELEAKAVTDEKTGETAFLVPREALEAIPDGSVVALMERSIDNSEMARANRVMVRRRRKGVRRNVNRGASGNQRFRQFPNDYWVMRRPAGYNNAVVRRVVTNNNGVVRRRVVTNNNGVVRRRVNNNNRNKVRYIRTNGNRRRVIQA